MLPPAVTGWRFGREAGKLSPLPAGSDNLDVRPDARIELRRRCTLPECPAGPIRQ